MIDQIKGDKVIHFVKRRRKHGSQRTKGHRQQLTLLRVTDILEKGADKSGVKAADRARDPCPQARRGGPAEEGAGQESRAEGRDESRSPQGCRTEAAAPKASAGADDLKQLSGVGPALEKKLHEAGVTIVRADRCLDRRGHRRVRREAVVQGPDRA